MSKSSKKKFNFVAPAVLSVIAVSTLMSGTANANTKTKTSQDSEIIRSVDNISSIRDDISIRNDIDDVAQNVTSVSQLSDVKSTDWAFTALQSLVERYGVIAGYPDRTYRGKQALSRYEFAAGLNSALDKINEIISTGLADKVSKEDLATLQKLQQEFAAELATLRGRIDALDAKTAKLEAQQFSTTTILNGQAIFSLAAGSDGVPTPPGATDKTNTIFSYRVLLNFNTSFTGKDLLRTLVWASNSPSFNSLAGSNSTRISYDGGFLSANNIEISRLSYRFPIGNDLTAYIAAVGQTEDIIDRLNPLTSDGEATISRFGRLSPLLRIASSNYPSIAAFSWKISDKVKFEAAYSASNPNQAVNTANTPAASGGISGGNTKTIAQFVFKPTDTLTLGVGYANSYTIGNSLGAFLTKSDDTGLIAGIAPSGIKGNTVTGNLIWDITNKITFNTSGSWTFANAIDGVGASIANATFTTWVAALSVKDIFSEGDLAAVLFGQPLHASNITGVGAVGTPKVPYHLETFYRFRISKNISITPGVFFVFNQGGDAANGTATVGVLRTTFSF